MLPLSCARSHSFQRLRTRINLLRTDILLNGHIVAHGLLYKYCKISHFKKSAHTHQNFCSHGLQKLRGNIGRTHKLSQNIGLLGICGYKKKKRHLSHSKIDFWGDSGRVVAPMSKIYVKHRDVKKRFFLLLFFLSLFFLFFLFFFVFFIHPLAKIKKKFVFYIKLANLHQTVQKVLVE